MSETRECRHCGCHRETFLIGLNVPTWLCGECAHKRRMEMDPGYARETAIAAAERKVIEAALLREDWFDRWNAKEFGSRTSDSYERIVEKYDDAAHVAARALRALPQSAAEETR